MKKHLLFSSALALTCLSSSISTAQNYGLNLANATNYVNCGDNSLLDPNNIKTMECWVKFSDLTGDQEILSRSSIGSGIELLLYNGNLSFFCMNSTAVPAATSHIDYPVSNLSADTWYHIAATWDGKRENMKLYVNGISVGSRAADIGNVNLGLSVPVGSFMIGQWSQLVLPTVVNRNLKGTVDEVRIWSTNRSAAEIKGGMYANYSSGITGLVAYYSFNEGVSRSIVNTLGNSVPAGSVVGPVSRVASPIQFASNALHFDGVDDQVVIPANSRFDLTTGTVECWVRPTAFPMFDATSERQSCFFGNRNTETRFSLHMDSKKIGLFNGVYGYKTLAYNFSVGTWYHMAFVFTASGTNVYVNGVLAGNVDFKPSAVTGQNVTIGITQGVDGLDMEAFTGDIDDVRVWNTMRTQQEISTNRNTALTGSEAGLVANYTFNAGIGSNTELANAGLKIALDATPNNLHGTLTNFALNGSTSNYVSSAVVILPVQLTSFSATKNGNASQLSWATAQEQNSKSFVVERSSDGKNFTAIGTVAANRNSSTTSNYSFTDSKPGTGTNYYRLQLVDADGKTSFSKTLLVKFQENIAVSVSPNPASSVLHYSFNSLQTAKVSISILSASGQKVQQFTATVQAGSNSLSADVSLLPAGNYTLQILNTTAGVTSSQQFSIVR